MTPHRMHSTLSGCSKPHLGQIIPAILLPRVWRAPVVHFAPSVARIVERRRGSVKEGRPRLPAITALPVPLSLWRPTRRPFTEERHDEQDRDRSARTDSDRPGIARRRRADFDTARLAGRYHKLGQPAVPPSLGAGDGQDPQLALVC